MNKRLDQIKNENNGYLLTSEAVKQGISKQSVVNYVKTLELEKVSNGIYVSEDVLVDDLYVTSIKNNGVIISHESALYLHGLMEKEPYINVVTVKTGYNATHIKKRGFKVYSVIPEYFEMGATQVITPFGNKVKCYDKERTICDIIRNKKNIDIQVYTYALKEYVKSKNISLVNLMNYARILNIEDQVRSIMELLI